MSLHERILEALKESTKCQEQLTILAGQGESPSQVHLINALEASRNVGARLEGLESSTRTGKVSES